MCDTNSCATTAVLKRPRHEYVDLIGHEPHRVHNTELSRLTSNLDVYLTFNVGVYGVAQARDAAAKLVDAADCPRLAVMTGHGAVAETPRKPASELRWRRDLNPRSVLADSRFQGECIRPLCHATAGQSKRDRSSSTAHRTSVPRLSADSSPPPPRPAAG